MVIASCTVMEQTESSQGRHKVPDVVDAVVRRPEAKTQSSDSTDFSRSEQNVVERGRSQKVAEGAMMMRVG